MKSNRRTLMVIIAAILVAMVMLIISISLIPQKAGTKTLIFSQNYDSWSYSARQDASGVFNARIKCDYNTKEGLLQYVEVNKRIAKQLEVTGGEVDVDVTLRTPMDPDRYREWAKNSGINFFEEVNLRDVSARGERTSIGMYPMSADPLPQGFVSSQANPNVKNSRILQGVVNVRGKIDAKKLPNLTNDTKVFLAEVTANIVHQDLQTKGLSDTDLKQATILNPVMLFWAVEDLGLEIGP